MHPFLNVSKLTDEEIIDKLNRAHTYVNAQVALGHNPTVHSIKEVIQALEEERRVRMQRIVDAEFKKKYPTDSNPIELGKLED